MSDKGSDSEEEEANRDSQSEKDDGSDRESDREQDEKQNKDDEAVCPDRSEIFEVTTLTTILSFMFYIYLLDCLIILNNTHMFYKFITL